MIPVSSAPARCYHCGTDCPPGSDPLRIDDKAFCCLGCQTVYSVLSASQLCQYYDLGQGDAPGRAAIAPALDRFASLDHPDIAAQLLDFRSDTVAHVTFFVPAIHCSACLWLLEHLYRIEPAISQTRVDFLKKQVQLVFDPAQLTLRQVAEQLTALGYEPLLSLTDVVQAGKRTTNRDLLYRLAVAGFGAGNIMLFSFPEYLGLDDPAFRHWFGLINLILATPVVFYAGSGYFKSVWSSLRHGLINIDVPILLGILVAYGRGAYEVLALGGAGYFDSVAGLIFFLLCGHWFQQRTYDFLAFDRDYKAYFPLAVQQLTPTGAEQTVPVADLRPGDRIRVRHGDLIPADALLYRGEGFIDYSFATGESRPERREPGALLYAGGRQLGGSIDLELVKAVSQSYLTQLWNNDAFRERPANRARTFADAVGTYFTLTVLALATLIGAYWYAMAGQPATAVNAFTAVLIVACPCVLSLSYPVALGHGLRRLSQLGLYLKQAGVIEQLAACDTIVFDKTGTLTTTDTVSEHFSPPLTDTERRQIGALISQSAHPLSLQLRQHLGDASAVAVAQFCETPGQGLSGRVDTHQLCAGRASFVGPALDAADDRIESAVHISIDGLYRGHFRFAGQWRPGLAALLDTLQQRGYRLFLLSGDSAGSRSSWQPWFADHNLQFDATPTGKLGFIRQLQQAGHRVLMIGDGLNDAGALKQADTGIALTDDTLRFTPASDAILDARSLTLVPAILRYSRFAMRLIQGSFVMSLGYNLVGLSFAATGQLAPVVAAILMPLSSATMVLIGTVGMRSRRLENPAPQPLQRSVR